MLKIFRRRLVVYTPWLLVATVVLLAVLAWGQSYGWALGYVSPYQVFPLLGLVAFSIMWTHYVVGTFTEGTRSHHDFSGYFRATGYVVLLAILLHPGILILERFRDGYGLPPGSYMSYVAPSLQWAVLLGSVSLMAFLAFELHRWFDNRSWWKYVLYANDAAMVGIFIHGLKLGSQLSAGWFRYVWLFYGISLVALLAYKYAYRLPRRGANSKSPE